MPEFPVNVKIVFDTNVILSATVFRKFAGNVYRYCVDYCQLYTSEWIVAEIEEKLRKKFKIPKLLQEDILDEIKLTNILINPDNELPTACRDADDNHILQLAQFVNADFIITGDRDLLDLIQFGKTAILSPREFSDRYVQQ